MIWCLCFDKTMPIVPESIDGMQWCVNRKALARYEPGDFKKLLRLNHEEYA
jgi:hypothetical protein